MAGAWPLGDVRGRVVPGTRARCGLLAPSCCWEVRTCLAVCPEPQPVAVSGVCSAVFCCQRGDLGTLQLRVEKQLLSIFKLFLNTGHPTIVALSLAWGHQHRPPLAARG